MDLLLYILIAVVVLTILMSFATYQFIGWLIVKYSDRPISEDQKEKCKKTLAEGKAPSPYCKVYIKKGKCGKKTCDVIQ